MDKAPGEGPRMVNVAQAIDAAPLSAFQWTTLALCCAVAMLDGFDTQSIAFVAPVLAQTWHISGPLLGSVFSAGLVGIMVGQFLFGPLADRYGRKRIIILCTALFSLFSLLTVRANNPETLLVLRFLTGLGVGGVTPNLIALTAELSPRRIRATLITLMFSGFALGAALGALLSSRMVPAFGWQSVFYVGGIVPALLIPLLVLRLPESVNFMVLKGRPQARIAQALDRIVPGRARSADERFVLTEEPVSGLSFKYLFVGRRGLSTLLLWTTFFMSLLTVYVLINWLPVVLKQSGLSLGAAISSSVFLNLGGAVGGVLFGWLVDRGAPFAVLSLVYLVAGGAILSIGAADGGSGLLSSMIFLAGACTVGGQTALNAATVAIYPTGARATGLGWALGVGRIGSVIGPIIGGVLVDAHWSRQALFTAGAAPALVAMASAILLGLVSRPARKKRLARSGPEVAIFQETSLPTNKGG